MTGGRFARALRAEASAALRTPLMPIAVTLGLCVAGSLLQFSAALNHDVGWLVVGARRLLDGALVYRDDFVDVNPPLALYLFAPAIVGARLFELSEIVATRILVVSYSVTSLLLCAWIARHMFDAGNRLSARYLLVAVAFVYLVWPGASLDGRPRHDFGQREHFVVLFTVPYLLAAAIRLGGRTLPPTAGFAAGLLLGVAVSLKPQYLLLVAGLEIQQLARKRSLRAVVRPEFGALILLGSAYLASILVFTPAYLETALPLGLRTYGAYHAPLGRLVRPQDVGLFLAAAVAVWWARGRSGLGELDRVLGIAVPCCFIAYLAGRANWQYHLLPYRSLAVLALWLPVMALLRRAGPEVRGRRLAAAGAALVTVLAVSVLPLDVGRSLREGGVWRSGGIRGELATLKAVVDRHAKGGTIWFLSSSVKPAFPLVNYAGVEWSSRFSCLWPLPAVARWRASRAMAADDGEMQALERTLLDWLVEDLRSRPPDLVFVETARFKQGFSSPFDFLEYLLEDPAFAQIWSGYELQRRVGRFLVFRRR